MRRQVFIVLAACAASAAVLAGAVFVLTRPSADFDDLHSYGVHTWGKLKPDTSDGMAEGSFRGTGTLVGMFSARNRRDHTVVLSVSSFEQQRLARVGIRRSVLFIPYDQERGYGAVERDADLARGSTTIPAYAQGEIVQVFHVDRCQSPGSWMTSGFPFEVDGHPARVDVALTDGDELWAFDRMVSENYGLNLAFGSCCRVDRLPTEEQARAGVGGKCVGGRIE